MKVMVTGAGALLGQGILRALLESPLRPEIVAVDPSPLSAGLYWVPGRHLVPTARDPQYLPKLEALLAAERPDALLVGTDVELGILAANRARLEEAHGTRVVVSSPWVVGVADDKFETARFFASRGFPAPDSALPEGVDAFVERVGFPLVVKPRVGARSVGVTVVHDRAGLAAALASVDAPVVQECVGESDQEYTAGTLTFDGECAACIVMRRDLRDGNTYRAFTGDFPELDRAVKAWAQALGAFGPANFQFRLDADGVPKVFEINARFSGTTPLRHRAGFPEVDMTLRHVLLGERVVQPPIERMTLLRHWSETVVREGELVTA